MCVVPMRPPLVVPSMVACAVYAVVALSPAGTADAQLAPGPTANPRAAWSVPAETFRSRVVASGFEDPWEVAWGPDGFLWITERVGKRVVRVDPASGERKVAVTIDEVYQTLAQDGLLGLVLHPQLARGSDYVYVMYTYDADAGAAEVRRSKIRRYTYDAAS